MVKQLLVLLGRWFWIPVIFVVIGLGLWIVPVYQTSGLKNVDTVEIRKLENEYRKTFGQIIGGLALLLGLFITWRRIRALERNVEISQESQITERFTRAIDQLGDKEHLEVRLGGIYALERIAKDSSRDHWTIMEILTAYVRVNAPWRGKADEAEEKRKGKKRKSGNSPQFTPAAILEIRAPADIQAILTVLERRTLAHEKGENRKLNLSETDLQGLAFHGQETHLEGANLSGAHLEGAHLFQAHLNGASLYGAHLENANLSEAHLEGADLFQAHLEGAHLFQAHLEGAHLFNPHLNGASLYGAHLGRAMLIEAHLEGADLDSAHLEEAHLFRAHLEGANLSEAHLEGANLDGTDLRQVKNITIEQLSKVKTLYNANLDPELMEQIKRHYPHLLEKPKAKE